MAVMALSAAWTGALQGSLGRVPVVHAAPPQRVQASPTRRIPSARAWNPALRACRVQEVDQVVQEGVQPSRLENLRKGQKLASAAALTAMTLGLAHLVARILSPDTRLLWLHRPRRHGAETLVALSGFLSAHPLEYPGLLLASSAVTGACEAAARVNCSRNYRSLYIALLIAGLCYLFDESAVAQQLRAVASISAGALFFPAYVVYVCLDWLSNGVSISEVFVGVRAARTLGVPQPWKPADPSKTRFLPKLYAVAEGMCLLEMGRSTLWRAGRLLPVLAALDELRRISSQPERLSSPEAALLNKGIGFWAWSALLEAALLGVVCSAWARQLGCIGAGAAITGLAASAVAAFPAAVVLAATFIGWSQSESALAKLTMSRSQEPPELIGRYSLQKLEDLYVDGIATFYDAFYKRHAGAKKLDNCAYYRIKVRLQAAGSKVVRYRRSDIQAYLEQAARISSVKEEECATSVTSNSRQEEEEPPATSVPIDSEEAGSMAAMVAEESEDFEMIQTATETSSGQAYDQVETPEQPEQAVSDDSSNNAPGEVPGPPAQAT
mmetsp:Transcript_13049/g.29784  ORF Transcript_13049/g.29784 Transcript_13049/m.29784 type:complete len:553 (+) Transcript_13049:47-1705(+)